MYQILLVEDDKSIREVIADYMDEKGKDTMRLTLAEDGRACEGALERQTFDLILLDVMLPDIDGFTLCRMIRKKDMVPIVFLTAKGSEEDILWGYGLGSPSNVSPTTPNPLLSLESPTTVLSALEVGALANTVSTNHFPDLG